MLPRIDRDQLIIVYMTAEHNDELMAENPPIMRRKFGDPAVDADMVLSTNNSAKYWDIYKDIVQLSFRHMGVNHHFLLCDDPDHKDIPPERGRVVTICSSEEEVVRKGFDFLWGVYGGENNDGKTAFYRLLAGWETHRTVWPLLVNRALKYRIKVPSAMLTDPERRWPTVYGLVDLSTMYSQAGGNSRYMPSLADVLRFWEFWEDGMGPMPANVRDMLCVDVPGVLKWVEPYLVGMDEVMMHYYSVPEPVHSELAGLPVPEFKP